MMSGGNRMIKRLKTLTEHPAFKRLSGEAFWVAFGLGHSFATEAGRCFVRHQVCIA